MSWRDLRLGHPYGHGTMHNLIAAMLDVDVLLEMPTEELASIILRLSKRRMPTDNGLADLSNYAGELRLNHTHYKYPEQKVRLATNAFREAYCWLEAQGLLRLGTASHELRPAILSV